MAGNFSVVTQVRSVQVLGPTQVLDVEQVGFVTHPSGVYAEFPIPLDAWRANHGSDLLASLAGTIEGLIAQGLAVGGSFVEDYDVNGLLVGYIEFVVQYDPPDNVRPPMTTTVRVPMESLLASVDPWFGSFATAPNEALLEAYDALVATANQ